jgi:hypothetical protein
MHLSMADDSTPRGYDWSRLQPVVGEYANVSIPFEIRPNPAIGKRFFRPGALSRLSLGLVAGVIAFGAAFQLGLIHASAKTLPPHAAGYALGLVIIALLWLLRQAYFQEAVLRVDSAAFVYRILPGIARRIPRTAIAGVVLRRVDTSTSFAPGQESKRLFLIGRNGRSVFRMNAEHFDYRDTYHLAAALAVPIDADWDFAVSRQSLSVEIPGAVLWPERHVTGLAMIGTLLVIVIGSIVMTLWQGPAR